MRVLWAPAQRCLPADVWGPRLSSVPTSDVSVGGRREREREGGEGGREGRKE